MLLRGACQVTGTLDPVPRRSRRFLNPVYDRYLYPLILRSRSPACTELRSLDSSGARSRLDEALPATNQ